jgi:hypothetical protein
MSQKQKKPAITIKQKKAARPKCRKLAEMYAGYEFVLDDESFFTKSNSNLSGNDQFYSDNLSKTPDDVKNKHQSKFEEKILVYQAISTRGRSKALFFKSGLAINQFVYRDKCLKKSLIPFLRKYHSHDRYVFWPDLASAHYARTVQDYLKSQRVPFVQRKLNHANVPKCRPIEDYWGILKRKVYENDWSAKEIPQLIKRIKWAMTQVDSETCTRTCASVHRRLNTVARKGVDAL